nr:hypothetical protein [Tanacetum cinerariifolium]
SIRLQSNLERLNSSLEFIESQESQEDLETKKADAHLEGSSMVEHQPDSDGEYGGCKFKSNLEGLNSSLEFIQSQEDLETKTADARLECSSMVEHQPDSDGEHGGCKFKIEDALTGLEVIEYEGNQIRLSLRTYNPDTDLPEQNHDS